jgi:hypothetical protein
MREGMTGKIVKIASLWLLLSLVVPLLAVIFNTEPAGAD